MRKGQISGGSAVLVVILIIVFILMYFLFQKPVLIRDFERAYSNDIIKIKNKVISDKNPLAGSSVSIEFYVSNNGDKTVEYVEVFFTNLQGLSDFKILQCEGGRIERIGGVDRKCIFDIGNSDCQETNYDCRIESLDARKVRVKLTTEKFTVATPGAIYYSISYNYSGKREMRIPIVSDPSFLPKEVKFDSGQPTYGPIQVEVKPPVGRERVEDKTTIVEHFAYNDTPFNIKFNLKDVGSSGVGAIQPVILERDNFEMNLENLEIVYCDKIDKNTKKLINENEKIPFSLTCDLNSTVTDIETYEIGTIKLTFNYNYKFINIEEFTVRPIR